MTKDVGGRPTVMTPEVLQKLETAFSYDFNNTEACLYADINEGTFYTYCRNNDGFLQRMKSLRSRPAMQAKINLANSVVKAKNVDDSKWLLERRLKDEYSKSPDANITLSNNISGMTIEGQSRERKKELYAALVRGKMSLDELSTSGNNAKLPVIDVLES